MESGRISNYFKQNWVKVALAILLVFIVMKKDLSFQVNLRSPVSPGEIPEQWDQHKKEIEKKEKKKTREKLADASNRSEKDTPSRSRLPKIDRFDLTPLGKEGASAKENAIQVLEKIDRPVLDAFIKRFGHVAVHERRKFGIPASITLANALLLSKAGTTELAQTANNFFTLPCTPDWKGETATLQNRCYRQYENAWTSFRDHSLFLTSGPLSHLKKIAGNDYASWAKALEKAKFSEEEHFAHQLISVIEKLRLDQLDQE